MLLRLKVVFTMGSVWRTGVLALLLGAAFAGAQAQLDGAVVDYHPSRVCIATQLSGCAAELSPAAQRNGNPRTKLHSSAQSDFAVLVGAHTPVQRHFLNFVRAGNPSATREVHLQFLPVRAPPLTQA